MFRSARLKLTLWYLAIIMAVSVVFSLIIYQIQIGEADRLLQRQSSISERFGLLRPGISIKIYEPDILEEARARLRLSLFVINLGVLVAAGGAAYFLAGRTLRPIEDVVEDQKRFVADASHELRTPLTTMKTELEVNLRDKKIIGEAKKALESNLEEVNKLSYLSDKLLRLSNYADSGELSTSEISLKETLEEAIEKVSAFAKSRETTIEKKLVDTKLVGDKASLVEAFGTILENAIKYSPKKSKVIVTSKVETKNAVVKIADFGVGIAEIDKGRIFDRFYRADQSRSKEKASGFGLGLSIAKAVVDKHKGEIKVDSKIDQGTTFTISLPKVNSKV
ncbi:MAG TPA: HAMP domain-containing sensor histidine kinase [Candidatus Saccharimonadales bacterium]|nr:HAMP domain-containing sensor histidine kinase [Candidatus Saccharimonadales bacterium]